MTERRWNRRAAAAGALAALIFLGACAGLQDDPFAKPPVGPCPSVLILRDAATAVVFRPGGTADPADVAYRLELAPVKSICRYNGDDTEIEVDVEIEVTALSGPAATGGKLAIPYFVAVIAPGDRILAKGSFEVGLRFGQGQARATARQRTKRKIVPGAELTGADFEVLMGLQLTPEQLDYNRRTADN